MKLSMFAQIMYFGLTPVLAACSMSDGPESLELVDAPTGAVFAAGTNPCGEVEHLSTLTYEGAEYTFCADDDGGVGVLARAPFGVKTYEGIGCALDVFLTVAPPELGIPDALVANCAPRDGNPGPEDLAVAKSAAQAHGAIDNITNDPKEVWTNYCGAGGDALFADTDQGCPSSWWADTHFDWCNSSLHTGSLQYTASTQIGLSYPSSHAHVVVASCVGATNFDFKMMPSGSAVWTTLGNVDVSANNSVVGTWQTAYNASASTYGNADYRSKATAIASGQFRFGGSYCDAVSGFGLCK